MSDFCEKLQISLSHEIEERPRIVHLRPGRLCGVTHSEIRKEHFAVIGQPVRKPHGRLEGVSLPRVRLAVVVAVIVGETFAEIPVRVGKNIFHERQLLGWSEVAQGAGAHHDPLVRPTGLEPVKHVLEGRLHSCVRSIFLADGIVRRAVDVLTEEITIVLQIPSDLVRIAVGAVQVIIRHPRVQNPIEISVVAEVQRFFRGNK